MDILLSSTVPAYAGVGPAYVYGETCLLKTYASRSYEALMLGLEYATVGRMEIDGETNIAIEKDTQFTPDVAIET
ncbi:hypothetical protein [uncultured Limimaricola sp.]|uniref:hypothetical protein n=1 Tax=uncultured Limimaricola sp. TaxID=2211667 RepID=UPI0030F5CFA1